MPSPDQVFVHHVPGPNTRERVRERVTFSSYPMVDNDFQKGVL